MENGSAVLEPKVSEIKAATLKDAAKRRLEINRGIKSGKSGIDREFEDEKYHGVIHGVAVMTKGNVKDMRAWEIDDTTLDQIVACGNKGSMGLKSRFGHPNMSSSALGTFLGRMKNFTREGDIARADLYISKTAYDTPEGDLASYVLTLAEKDPDAFGTSVVLGDFELEYKIEKDGTPKKDAEGNELPPLLRVTTLLAVDVVDDPAANDGMFSRFFNSSVELSAKATEFLDNLLNNPDALEYVVAFLERFRVNRVDIDASKGNKAEVKTVGFSKKEDGMELKELTLDQLKAARPDLVSSLQNEATQSERTRAVTIIKHNQTEFTGMNLDAVMLEAVESGKTVDAALASMRGKRLEDLNKKGNVPPGADAVPEGKKDHLAKAKEYQALHKCSIAVALSVTADARK